MKKILFFGEPATLAHVARPAVLASGLDKSRFEVEFATGPDFENVARDLGLCVRRLDAIGTRRYLAAVAGGRVVFPYEVLEGYVREDLQHIEAFKPDVIVGDFRLSLAVSARLARVPYVLISNAYWSPFSSTRIEIPAHPATRVLGARLANALFQPISGLILGHHAAPMNRLLRAHGMSPLGPDLRKVFTEADVTLFADVPELAPTEPSAPQDRYRYVGPVVWSPRVPLPSHLSTRRLDGLPLVYVSLGSSGDRSVVSTVVKALTAHADAEVVVAGQPVEGLDSSDRIHFVSLAPGDVLARLSRVVVCNGGSPGCHQALLEGTPVLGIPTNLDQLLNMQGIVSTGVGLSARSDSITSARISKCIDALLQDSSYANAARRMQSIFAARKPVEVLESVLLECDGSRFTS